MTGLHFPTVEETIGNTPLVRLQRMYAGSRNTVLLKLEGNNPAGSVKDRPAMNMIRAAETAGAIVPGDTLVEATSGNTGIALAMAAAIKGYRMLLIMPEDMSDERSAIMHAFGAEVRLVSKEVGIEGARDMAAEMDARGEAKRLDQFANINNPEAHIAGTGPEIWQQTHGRITHFVSAMGTTGTITGVSKFLKEKRASIEIIGVQPKDGEQIPGIRKWPPEYIPSFFVKERIDRILEVSRKEAEDTARRLAREEGIFAGPSSGGALCAALRIADTIDDAVIVSVVCDRGDRYISTGIFP